MEQNIEDTTTNNKETVFTLKITDKDLDTITWVGHRYCWSTVLGKYCFEEGNVELTQGEADEIIDEFNNDTEGGHSYFPCLAPGSSLYSKLVKMLLWDEESKEL